MRLRIIMLAVYITITLLVILWALSDHIFNDSPSRKALGRRLLLSLVWPLALFSKSGRHILFINTKGL